MNKKNPQKNRFPSHPVLAKVVGQEGRTEAAGWIHAGAGDVELQRVAEGPWHNLR